MSAQAERYRRSPCGHGHGLVGVEVAIMDLHDEGLDAAAIARVLDRPVGSVRKIVNTYRVDGSHDRLARNATASSSQALLRAQLRAGQHHLSPAMAVALRAALGMRA